MTGVGKKLLVWFLVCSVIFSAHAFLARTMYLEITSPDPRESFVAWMIIMTALNFPLSMLALPADAIFQFTNSPRSTLLTPLFFLFVGTLNWILLILIIKCYSFHKIISLCLLLGAIVGGSTITIDGFFHGFDFGHFFLFCVCMYWSFWAGFVLSVIVRSYTNIRSLREKR